MIGTAHFFQDGSQLRDGDFILLECRGKQDRRILHENLFKLARWKNSSDDMNWKVYFRSDKHNELFSSDTCKIPSALAVYFQKAGYKNASPVDWKDVKDIVIKHRDEVS